MKKCTTNEFIERAKQLHGDRYDYSKVVYESMHVPVAIICKKHGVFYQSPSNHLKGHGCSICNKKENRRVSIDEFIKRSQKVHGVIYDYSQVEYVNSKTPVKIICPVHGMFMQTPEHHWSGECCPLCRSNHKDTKESFIKKAQRIHGTLYDYSKVDYVNSQTKVCIIDPVYGEFWQIPNAHLNGEGNPRRKPEKCYITKKRNGTLNSSKPEKCVEKLLCDKFGKTNVYMHYKSAKYPFVCDFYIVSLDVYIELNIYVTHGGHWFNANDENDIERLRVITERATDRNMYANMIRVWTNSDLKKRDTAIANDLNYLVFWDYDLSDFLNWYNSFDETHILKQF